MESNPHYEEEVVDAIQKQGTKQIVLPKGLSIVWGNDDRYWKLSPELQEPAILLQVSWLEVTGSVNIEPSKSYDLSFTLSLTSDAFGWSGVTLYVMTKRGNNGKTIWKKFPLDLHKEAPEKTFALSVKSSPPKPPRTEEEDRKLYFGLYEIWSGRWKGGLKIHCVEVEENNSKNT